ncbi:hypothetical protein [Nostoc sp.]|uniref:hypothetical protein n=1 Tax=Nostoc sp. TaxID=1180 RepID=UPI002FF9BCC7
MFKNSQNSEFRVLIPFLCEAAPNFLSSFVTAVAHGGNPQDCAASPLRPLRFVPYIIWRIFIQNWYEAEVSSSELGLSSSEAEVPSSELGLSSSKAEVPSSELGLSSSEAEVPSSELGLSSSKAEVPSSELGLSSSKAEVSNSQIKLLEIVVNLRAIALLTLLPKH